MIVPWVTGNLWRVGGVLPALLTLAPGRAHAEDPASAAIAGGAGASWLVAIALAGSGGLALLSLLAAYRNSDTRRQRVLRGRLNKLDLPAAISGVDGRLHWSNPAMRAAFDDGKGDIVQCLDRGIEVDAGQIYRLATRAREMGFAFQPVPSRLDEGMVVLSARLDGPSSLVWTVCPPDRLPNTGPVDAAAPYQDAPFSHMRIDRDGNATTNPQFRAIFGDRQRHIAELIDGDQARALRRAVLPRKDGETQFSSIYVIPATGGDADSREIFIFPANESVEAYSASATLDAVPVALMQFDFDGRALWHNASARDMLGRELPPGTALADIVEPLGRPVSALISDSFADNKGRREMVRLRCGAPETFAQISLVPVTLGASPSLLAVLSDASELRLLEDKFTQSQKMEAVGKLAGGVAHDFNNVLTAISGHSDLLLLGKDALHQDYSDLMQIRQNTHRAAALVRQLLAFSRKQTLNPALMSVQDVVSDTQYLLNRLIGEKVTLSMEHGRDLGLVRADHQQVEQALMNLVVNARDAMPHGGMIIIATGNVTVADENAMQGIDVPTGEYVEISVSDNGAGIEPHLIDRVFDPFFTTKPVGEGTGLGLATVYGIVKQSGGFIFAENRAEGGARFRILLPRAYPGAEDRLPVRDQPRIDRGDQTGTGAVLLVEDEDPVRSFAARALRLRGYEVAEAASAEEAMELLSDTANRVDVLVSDVVMPGMDGPTFAANARRMRPGLRVVFISGYAEDSFRRNLVDHDFLFLPKPFSLTDLTAKVKEALDQGA